MSGELEARVLQLAAAFEHIARSRMADVPVLHPGVHVQALGFQPLDAGVALGVLISPWFMNLVRLPLQFCAEHAIGQKRSHAVGAYEIEFTSAYEPAIGSFEVCSLFSPITQFADQEAVEATAREVLAGLRAPPRTTLSRRAVLFGKREPREQPTHDRGGR